MKNECPRVVTIFNLTCDVLVRLEEHGQCTDTECYGHPRSTEGAGFLVMIVLLKKHCVLSTQYEG